MMKKIIYYDSALGRLGIVEENDNITDLLFEGEAFNENYEIGENPLLLNAKAQLEEYFMGKRRHFDLPIGPKGTDFQRKVWDALQKIPFGQTISYGDIAKKIGCDKGARAVGMANNKNPIPIFIPCHRVIGADGKLVGYAGGIETKIRLLEIEGIKINGRGKIYEKK